MISSASLFVLGLSASLISASPMREPVTEDHVQELRSRAATVGEMINAIPSCDDDPSYATVKSGYDDGEGVYLTSACENNKPLWIHRCWTDIYLVEWQYEYTAWENKGMDIDCATTKDCQRQASEVEQHCEANTESWDNKIQGTIEGKVEKIAEKFGVTAKLEYAHNWGGSQQFRTCTSGTQAARCTWDDQECHSFWTARRNHRIHGYARRTCNTGRDGTNMNSKRESDGYYTVGMRDFSLLIPDSYIVGCGAKCGDTSYPDPPPTGDVAAYPVEP